ncbi:MAG: NTP transferase domain-containing protein [Candidatus Magasanikbacteria bacterium]|nr:NTP transferase domain-containing protein [Candidatus Magasanikbacteria bacterium]
MLNSKLSKVGAVIMAAGKGTRLNCTDKPKVMCEIGGKPIVSYVVDTLRQIGFKKEQICLVVGFKKEKIEEYLKDKVSYAVQEQQLGTGHAAYTGMINLPGNITEVLVMGGDDSAFYSAETILDLISRHERNKATVSVLSVELDEPSLFGRIVKYDDGRVEIIEKEYLTEEQKKIKEINAGTYVFNRSWFENMFPRMPKMKKLGEFGINPSVTMAQKEGKKIQVVKLQDNQEWFGVNTPAELEEADKRKSII